MPIQDWHSMYRDAPHAHLLQKNSFFDVLASNKVRLLHVTTDLETVVKSGALFSSRGCLVGTVYCTPLFTTNEGLRAHNLGSYIYKREAGRCLAAQGAPTHRAKALVIDIDLPAAAPKEIVGVNYLQLGEAHLQTFTCLQYLLPRSEIRRLQRNISTQVKAAHAFLKACHKVATGGSPRVSTQEFFSLATDAIYHLPILGYFYFEALSETIMLCSTDEQSQLLAEKGEFNAWSHKEFAFNVWPALLQNFNLGGFRPSLNMMVSTLGRMNHEATIKLDIPLFLCLVQDRFTFLVDRCLLETNPMALHATKEAGFEELAEEAGSLLGHAIDREIRMRSSYDEFRIAFDTYEAQQIWDYWSSSGLYLPFNGIIPKGEIGVNPKIAPQHITIREADSYSRNGELYFRPGHQLNVTITPELIHPKFARMGLKQP